MYSTRTKLFGSSNFINFMPLWGYYKFNVISLLPIGNFSNPYKAKPTEIHNDECAAYNEMVIISVILSFRARNCEPS